MPILLLQMTAAAQWLNNAFAAFDEAILTFAHKMHECAAGGFFDFFFPLITRLGDGGIFFIVLSFVLIVFKKTRKVGLAMIIAIIIGSLFTNVCIKNVVARPRPCADEASLFHQWWLEIGHGVEREFSFPSGHATVSFASMGVLLFLANKKGAAGGMILAALIGFSRNYIYVHYPSDILGGIIVGIFSAFLASLIVKAIYKKTADKKTKFAAWLQAD